MHAPMTSRSTVTILVVPTRGVSISESRRYGSRLAGATAKEHILPPIDIPLPEKFGMGVSAPVAGDKRYVATPSTDIEYAILPSGSKAKVPAYSDIRKGDPV